MKQLIPAAGILVIIVIVMILAQPAPIREEFITPIVIEQPGTAQPAANESLAETDSIKIKGARMSAELDAAIAEYYQIIYHLKHEQDPTLQFQMMKYHAQWLDENAMKFYNYRHFIETNFNDINALGLNPAQMLEEVNADLKVMEQNRVLLLWNGTITG